VTPSTLHRYGLPLALLALPVGPAIWAQAPAGQAQSQRMEIVLEKREGANWRAVDPRLVLEQGDRVRFRIRTNFDGYLYVMNQSTSGRYTLLFPTEDSGQKNQIQSGRDYLIPATQGSFRIAGPPGQEIVYWLVTPVELQSDKGQAPQDYVPLPPPPKPGKIPPTLTPRCDDTIFRARGDCVDTSAGPRPVPENEALPENLAGRVRSGSGIAPRELLFMRQQNSSVVASPAATGPAIFEFRLAHK
jgi:Domain of unknown function (DUF4384)